MIYRIILILLYLILPLIPLTTNYYLLFPKFVAQEKLPKEIKKSKFISLKNKSVVDLINSKVLLNFEEFIDFDKRGYYVTYDKMAKNIQLYYHDKKIHEIIDKNLYPRIRYPYLFLFSSSMNKVTAYRLNNFSKPAFNFKINGMFSDWHADSMGKYAILGDINGNYYIYDSKTKKIKNFKSPKGKINFVKGVRIKSDGKYLVVSSLYPEYLTLGDYHNNEKENYTINLNARKQIKISMLLNYHVFETGNGLVLFNHTNQNIYKHRKLKPFYKTFCIKKQERKIYFFIFRKGIKNYVDVMYNNRYFYTFHFESEVLPQIYQSKDSWIIFEKGAIKL